MCCLCVYGARFTCNVQGCVHRSSTYCNCEGSECFLRLRSSHLLWSGDVERALTIIWSGAIEEPGDRPSHKICEHEKNNRFHPIFLFGLPLDRLKVHFQKLPLPRKRHSSFPFIISHSLKVLIAKYRIALRKTTSSRTMVAKRTITSTLCLALLAMASGSVIQEHSENNKEGKLVVDSTNGANTRRITLEAEDQNERELPVFNYYYGKRGYNPYGKGGKGGKRSGFFPTIGGPGGPGSPSGPGSPGGPGSPTTPSPPTPTAPVVPTPTVPTAPNAPSPNLRTSSPTVCDRNPPTGPGPTPTPPTAQPNPVPSPNPPTPTAPVAPPTPTNT